MRNLVVSAACAACLVTPAFAHGPTIAKDHAPIGVMGDHMHKQGEIMFSYRLCG